MALHFTVKSFFSALVCFVFGLVCYLSIFLLPLQAFGNVFLPVVTKGTLDSKEGKLLAATVFSLLQKENGFRSSLGTKVAILQRSEFAAAHPEINLDSNTIKVTRVSTKKRMISSVQNRLEALALNQAFIVDCKQNSEGGFTNCGLYKYSRDNAAITASSSRIFRTKLTSVQSWGKELADTFSLGLKVAENRVTEKKLQEFMEQSKKEEEETNTFLLGAKGGFDSWSVLGSKGHAFAGVNLRQRNKRSNDFYLGFNYLKGEGTMKTDSGENKRLTLHSFKPEIGFDLRAETLETMVWTLGVSAHYRFTKLPSEQTLPANLQGIGGALNVGVGTQMSPQSELGAFYSAGFEHLLTSTNSNLANNAAQNSLSNTKRFSQNFGVQFQLSL